ncbi:isopenicillin N synthase family dioxygenase [Nodularia sphaerocarpa]|uniref:isopenicillin N synthase family dioxygenase n=1 Tax=Nodularia sphaerocarpa TaxID=137816 RepID=UPI001EFBECAF|nr:2-oxoglutarate and iron-dependent oxygenase domain-containing protein [Nodularia sphaerocarpa]MDB9373585.1 2-oxoglutarate and iron-dependent oxygenase domain-containing protein [Nodularia sphaerocarpa CS-585]MDB9378030.1 2-oxoglutarate and iron-dependent oxygenase domain-containing protein [Nodularia sphaerocarpa CS-585A2]ULP74373.1 putative dioxygenase [Nodularia sphaerocarpa UHCC 0038]
MNPIKEPEPQTIVSTAIPIIDFHQFMVGDTVTKEAVAEQMSSAIQEMGCFYLNNSVPQTLVEQVFAEAHSFFALPQEKKNQTKLIPGTSRGYVARGKERVLLEAFNFGLDVATDEAATHQRFGEPNQWPNEQIEFRRVLLEFFTTCRHTSFNILQGLAIALKLPESYFTNFHTERNFNTSINHYPPLQEPLSPGETRFAEHTDYGSITLIFQDQTAGLEVYTNAGEWIAAPYLPGKVLVILADLMQRWTNDKFPATKHRVPLPSKFPSEPRYSIIYFESPDYDAEITCIENSLDAKETPKYQPILTHEYINQVATAGYKSEKP